MDTSSPFVLRPNWCPGLASWGTQGAADGTVRLWRVETRRLGQPESAVLLAGAAGVDAGDGGEQQQAAGAPLSAEVVMQVDAIFAWLNHADATGLVKCGMMQRLAGKTGGHLSADDFVLVCKLVGDDPDLGLSKAGLLSLYTDFGLGDPKADFDALKLGHSAIGRAGAMKAAGRLLDLKEAAGRGRAARGAAAEETPPPPPPPPPPP
eukprot:SAG22_NODE_3400_length_1733_cov_3.424725_1_plen_206_part_10